MSWEKPACWIWLAGSSYTNCCWMALSVMDRPSRCVSMARANDHKANKKNPFFNGFLSAIFSVHFNG